MLRAVESLEYPPAEITVFGRGSDKSSDPAAHPGLLLRSPEKTSGPDMALFDSTSRGRHTHGLLTKDYQSGGQK